jgi:hypothetical protein
VKIGFLFALRKEDILRMFQMVVKKGIFVYRKEWVSVGKMKLHSKRLHDLYYFLCIIRTIK